MPDGAILSDDLIFVSRVIATAQAKSRSVEHIRSVSEMCDRLATISYECVMVDLSVAGKQLSELSGIVREKRPNCRIIAYGPHVDVQSLEAARTAGCDLVLPRSAFAGRLESELSDWLTSSS